MNAFIPKLCCFNCRDYCARNSTDKPEKVKGIFLKPFGRYCLAGKKGRELKPSEGIKKIPVWCPKKIAPVMSVYDFKDAESRWEYEMLLRGQSFEYPNEMAYRCISSSESPVTVEKFTEYIDTDDRYPAGTVIVIFDGIRSVSFFKHSLNGWQPVFFRTEKTEKEETT